MFPWWQDEDFSSSKKNTYEPEMKLKQESTPNEFKGLACIGILPSQIPLPLFIVFAMKLGGKEEEYVITMIFS